MCDTVRRPIPAINREYYIEESEIIPMYFAQFQCILGKITAIERWFRRPNKANLTQSMDQFNRVNFLCNKSLYMKS